MNDKIYKYTLEITDTQEILLPINAEILSVKEQNDNIVIYVFVEEDMITNVQFDTWRFQIRGTGHYSANFKRENYRFLDTVKLRNGALMFHVFCRKLDKDESR